MTDEELKRVEDEGRFLLSKFVGDAQASAIEHLAGAILLAAVVLARKQPFGDSQ